jgi:O-antigen biosynthesis protein
LNASIIIVNYNSRLFLESCLCNLQANTELPCEFIIIDNHSSDDSVAFLRGIKHPSVRVLLNHTNAGFAKACNQGIAQANGNIIVTMNPDVLVPPGWLSRLAWHLNHHPNTLAVGPKGIGIGGRQAALPLSYSSKLEAADRKFAKKYRRQSEPVKCLIGCLMLFDSRLIKEIGYFDEELPLGADDFDISLRIRKAGYQLRIAWDVLIKHFVHVSFNCSNPEECQRLETESYHHFNLKWAKELKEFGWQRLLEDDMPVFPHEIKFQAIQRD